MFSISLHIKPWAHVTWLKTNNTAVIYNSNSIFNKTSTHFSDAFRMPSAIVNNSSPMVEMAVVTNSFWRLILIKKAIQKKLTTFFFHRYSYGQPVRGNVRANIKVKSDSRYSHRRYFMTPMPVIDFDRTGALNGDTGCYILKLPGDQIGISTYSGSIQKSLQVRCHLQYILNSEIFR